MGKGAGYAKTILLGEHFVVYGEPAIGLGLSKRIEVEVAKANHTMVESSHADANLLKGFEAIKAAMKVQDNFTIRIRSEIPMGSGLGTSAAVSVAFVRAVADECKLRLSEGQVSAYAHEAEKVHHGAPSGIDDTLAAMGGAILFRKGERGNEITSLRIGKPLNIVIGNTGKKRGTTGEIIAAVKARMDRSPGVFADLSACERRLIDSAVKAIEQGNHEALGELMNINHGLLSALGVSSRENEDIVQAAREAGALGAKITGAGRGGSCVILAKNEKNADEIANEVKKLGYLAITAAVQ